MEEKQQQQEVVSEKPNFGIKTLTSLKFPKQLQDTDKTSLKDIYNCFYGPRIVKVETTLNNMFILFSDGKLMARGKDFSQSKGDKAKKSKDFEEIKFRVTDRDINITVVSIAAGEEHLIVLDFERNVWGWGNNKNKQINPYSEETFFKRFVRLEFLKYFDQKVTQIYCMANTSLFIFNKNSVKMIGSTTEGYLGEDDPELFKDGKTKGVFEHKLLKEFITNSLQRNEHNITDTFINSKKIFNTKFTLILMENYQKSQQVESLIKTRNALQEEIKKKEKKSIRFLANLKNESKEVNMLINLLNKYEEKINKITIKKDDLRKTLVFKDNEINQKNIDFNHNTEEIEKVEAQIEDLNNEVSDLNNKLYEKNLLNKNEIQSDIFERKSRIDNLKINKDSLITNLQILIVYIEKKEKEKYNITQMINDLTKEENEIIRNRNIVEDMMTILMDNTSLAKTNKKDDLGKNKYNDLFNFFDALEENTFTSINKSKPYLVLEDILFMTDKELLQLTKDLEYSKSSLSDAMKLELDVIYRMMELKIALGIEQNCFIRYLYFLFVNLEEEIKKVEREKMKDSSKRMPHSEIIYKNLINNFLNPLKKEIFEGASKEEDEKIDLERNDYKAMKRRNFDYLVQKSKYNPEEKYSIDVSKSFQRFSYEDEPSSFKWVK